MVIFRIETESPESVQRRHNAALSAARQREQVSLDIDNFDLSGVGDAMRQQVDLLANGTQQRRALVVLGLRHPL